MKKVKLYVAVNKEGRICWTSGSKSSFPDQYLTKEYRIVLLSE